MEARGTTMRLANAFHNRWRVIQRNASKFSGAWAAIEGRNASGKTFDDKVRDSCTLYQMQNQTAFTMLPLWLLLRNTQKLGDLLSKPVSKPLAHGNDDGAAMPMSADDVEGSTEKEGGRPVGEKKAKRRLEEERESLAESGRLMADESQRK
jgi:hypothetical protein